MCMYVSTEIFLTGRKRKDKPKQLFQLSTRKENLIKDLAYDDCQKLYEFLYGSSEPEPTTLATASSETNTPNPSSAESSPQVCPYCPLTKLVFIAWL